MLDNHTPERRPETAGGARDSRAESRPERMADREVPLRRTSRTPAAVHAWLDGDLPEAAVRRGDTAKHVEFWKELNTEADKRRQMRTPPHVYAQIMSSLPQTTPRVITPWWRRQFAMTPAIAMAVGTALLLVGAAVAMMLVRSR
jgi:hypothetical protein